MTGIVPNISYDIYKDVFEEDGREEEFIPANEGRKISEAIIRADPNAFKKRKFLFPKK